MNDKYTSANKNYKNNSIVLKKLLDKKISLPLLDEVEYPLIQYYDVNNKGTDYVVGDIHNQFKKLDQQLKKLNFNTAIDRLFCVGDLIDRGCEGDNDGYQVLELLNKDWFYSIRGNHEDLLLTLLSLPKEQTQFCLDLAIKNGGDWLFDDPLLESELSQYCINELHHVKNEFTFNQLMNDFPKVKDLYQELSQLPYVIQIGDDIGIVHAELPLYIRDWSELINQVKSYSMDTLESLLWGRQRISYDINDVIAGIKIIYCGHSITQKADNYGNLRNIDTGSYARKETLLHIEEVDPEIDYGISDTVVSSSLTSDDIVSYHQNDGFSYVRFSELSEENQVLYQLFSRGKTCPVIEGEKIVYYSHDYDYFLSLKNQYLKKYNRLDEFKASIN